jgi:Family of unknown function (DUF5906)
VKNACQITIFTRHGGKLSKRIDLGDNGRLVTTPAAAMTSGSARRAPIVDVRELAAVIERLDYNEAIALGALRTDLPEQVKVVTKDKLNGAAGVIARTGDFICYQQGQPTFALLDFDPKGKPAEIVVDDFWAVLIKVLPALRDVGRVIRRSTSAGLHRTDTGEMLDDSGGMHVFVVVHDGTDIERFLTTLHERCWLLGYGWIMISKAGQLLERSIVDRSVGAPERLVFEAPPTLSRPLAQDAASRRPIATDGAVLDTHAACLPLTADERATFDKLVAEAKARIAPEADKVRAAYIDERAEALAKRKNITKDEAVKVIENSCRSVLLPDFELEFSDKSLGTVTVADVLHDPLRFEKKSLADPIEGVEYGRTTAMVLLRRDNGRPWIRSHAHGGVSYSLERAESAERAQSQRRAEQIAENMEIGDDIPTESILPSIMTLNEMHGRLVFVSETGGVADHVTGHIHKREHATDAYAASKHVYTHVQENGAKKERTGSALKFWIESKERVTVQVLAWIPGAQQICHSPEEQKIAFNTWKGLPPMTFPDDWQERVKPFLEHVEFLVPIKEESERFLQWLAHIIQCPEVLPHTSYLMTTPTTGVGRNLLASMIVRALRGFVAAGISLPELLDGGFTGRLSKKLLAIVDEAREGSGDRRHQRAERLKSIITEEHRHVNPKYGHQSVEKNCCRWLMFSNHQDAIPFDNSDRRVIVIANPTVRKEAAYYERLFRLLDDNAFIGSVRRWLETLDISGFRPGEHAPMNEAKLQVLNEMMTETERAVLEFKEDCETDLTSRYRIRCHATEKGQLHVNDTHLTHAIRRAGMTNTGRRVWTKRKDDKKKILPTEFQQRLSVVIVKGGEWNAETVKKATDEELLEAMGEPS